MNVAIIIDNFNGGGAERVAQYLGDYLIERGARVFYFLLYESRNDVYKVLGSVVYTGLGDKLAGFGTDKYKDKYTILICGKALKQYKKIYNIDVSVSFMEMCNYLNVVSRYKDKVILSIHTTLSARKDYTGTLYNSKNIRRLCEKADKVVAVSEYIKNDLKNQYNVKDSPIVVIPNTHFMKEDTAGSDYDNSAEDYFLSVGRLVGVKQHDRIIRAFSYVRNKNKKVKLYVLGTGNNLEYLKFIVKRMGIEDSVIFKGFCHNVDQFYKKSRALVMASMAEGFPNVMVEAMSNGLPVITTDSPGGCGEIVGKIQSSRDIQYCKYGILTPYIKGKAPRSIELEQEEILLGRAMLEILEDEALYQRYHEASCKRAEYYGKDRIMKMWYELIVSK